MKIIFSDKKPRDECAIFGVSGNPQAAQLVALGLHALQHRGQDSTGVVTTDNTTFFGYEEIN